jgi:hypothetical protein
MITIWLMAKKANFKPLFSHRFHSGSNFAINTAYKQYNISFFPFIAVHGGKKFGQPELKEGQNNEDHGANSSGNPIVSGGL